MSSNIDDLDALFDAEAAQYESSASPSSQQSSPATPVAAEVKPVTATASVAPVVTEPAQNTLDGYYQVVNGLYLREDPALTSADAENSSENPMFERLGGIVRLLHDSLRELGYDKSLSEASSQIGEAKDRLEYIASLTEQSAVKVLNTLDEGIPAQEALVKQGKAIEERWALLFEGKIGIEEFKVLAADSRKFASTIVSEGEKEKARLLEIMMAQDFQDLTGQIIKKVVGVTKQIEHDLAQLLLENAPAKIKVKHNDLMNGPSLPDNAMIQDDVDDLLADLGF
ncbi:MAG: protein phosphatase CheZ [Burkholderiales bacterium]|nr:protein phosphatase CheZ [Burkholderiales bacterium]